LHADDVFYLIDPVIFLPGAFLQFKTLLSLAQYNRFLESK